MPKRSRGDDTCTKEGGLGSESSGRPSNPASAFASITEDGKKKNASQINGTLVLGDSTIARINKSTVAKGLPGDTITNHAKSGQTTKELISNLQKQQSLLPSSISYRYTVIVTGKNDFQSTPHSDLADFLKGNISSICSIIGDETQLFMVGIGCRPCDCKSPHYTITARGRVNACCNQMKRREWSTLSNSILETLSGNNNDGGRSSFQYIPPPHGMDDWSWEDGIHLSAVEHERYVGHIANSIKEEERKRNREFDDGGTKKEQRV